jgi:DNA-binding transcriptional LysR family regulator
MNFNELKAFIVVAEELNFRKAAERLAMTQPPLTRLIAKLEDDLRTQLFLRSTRRVEITAAGISLLKDAREILAKVAEAEASARKIGALKKGELSIGFSRMAFYSNFPNVLSSFREFFPKVEVALKERALDKIAGDLKSGRIDIAFCELPPEGEGYETALISSHSLGVLLPLGHPFAKKKRIKLKELTGSSFILHPRSEAGLFHDSICNFLGQHGLDYSIRYRKKGEICPLLVSAGQGLLLALATDRNHLIAGTKFVELENPTPKYGIYALWNKDNPRAELKSMASFLKEQASLEKPCIRCLMGVGSPQNPA